MRILLVGNYQPDQQQSMQRYAQWLLAALRAMGFTVVLIRPAEYFSKLAIGPLQQTAVAKYLGYLDKFLIFPGQLSVAARQYDLVHICDHSNSMYLKATAGKPAVITCHDVLAIRSALGEFEVTKTGWTGRWLQAWILRGLRKAQEVVCVSEKTAEDLRRLAGPDERKMHRQVILNPLNWRYKHQPNVSEALRARLGAIAGEPYFLHVGGNQWYKNRPGVVRIFRQLASMEEFGTARLLLAGKPLTGDLQKTIAESGVSDRIIALTGTSNEELETLYSNALALIFPSLEEGFGWPIAEAQACGCPVATTNRPPMTEVAGGTVILFDPDDPVGAAQAIAAGLRQREQLSEEGLKNVARFDEEKIVEEYRSLYASILTGRA